MQEHVFFLQPTYYTHLGGYRSRTHTIWAKSKEEAIQKMESWKHFGFIPKYLYPLADFQSSREKEILKEEELKQLEKKHSQTKIEAENV